MSKPSKKHGRIRPHTNPLSIIQFAVPNHPDQYDWHRHYPEIIPPKENPNEIIEVEPKVTILDIGSGFGGLIQCLSSEFKDELILGIEIRSSATEITKENIEEARANGKTLRPDGTTRDWNPQNIGVLNTNIMKYAPNYFHKGQLNKMFILFGDPHFKRTKHRLRVINPTYLDIYAYLLKVGGILYTISDVEALYLWQKKHLDEHPLFERIPDEELTDDVCFDLIHNGTHEGQKVTKNKGNKYPAVYRRVEFNRDAVDLSVKHRVSILE